MLSCCPTLLSMINLSIQWEIINLWPRLPLPSLVKYNILCRREVKSTFWDRTRNTIPAPSLAHVKTPLLPSPSQLSSSSGHICCLYPQGLYVLPRCWRPSSIYTSIKSCSHPPLRISMLLLCLLVFCLPGTISGGTMKEIQETTTKRPLGRYVCSSTGVRRRIRLIWKRKKKVAQGLQS